MDKTIPYNSESSLEQLAADILNGNRIALARAITLVESTLPKHSQQAESLLEKLLPHTGRSHRIGVTGPPGVGKSSLIEALGLCLLGQAQKVAVLAIDPSSEVTGGSILGDKTRMHKLSLHPQAYVRPSPAGGFSGGISRHTREALWLCEAAGYETIMVETVGVGQSETAVSQLVDTVILVTVPGTGDEIQGIKRGLMEKADIIAVNKSDLGNSELAAANLKAALTLLPESTPGWKTPVIQVSAHNQTGIDQLLKSIHSHYKYCADNKILANRRQQQALYWMERILEEGLKTLLLKIPEINHNLHRLRRLVIEGRCTPDAAAKELLSNIYISTTEHNAAKAPGDP